MTIDELIVSDRYGPELALCKPSWEEDEKIPEHTISHPETYPPVDCSCKRMRELEDPAAIQKDFDH